MKITITSRKLYFDLDHNKRVGAGLPWNLNDHGILMTHTVYSPTLCLHLMHIFPFIHVIWASPEVWCIFLSSTSDSPSGKALRNMTANV